MLVCPCPSPHLFLSLSLSLVESVNILRISLLQSVLPLHALLLLLLLLCEIYAASTSTVSASSSSSLPLLGLSCCLLSPMPGKPPQHVAGCALNTQMKPNERNGHTHVGGGREECEEGIDEEERGWSWTATNLWPVCTFLNA